MNKRLGHKMAVAIGVLFASTLATGTLHAADSDAATRQYAAAAALQNRAVYDLAINAWVKFIQDNAADSRIDRAYHYLGMCYYKTAVGEIEAKHVDAAESTLGFARQCFETVQKDYPKFELQESNYLYLGNTQFKQAQLEESKEGKDASKKAKALYGAAAATLDTLVHTYPQGKNLAQSLYLRGDCAYHTDDKAAAAKYYGDALTKSPDEKQAADITYALGFTQAELGQQAEAGKSYDDFLRKFPQHPLVNEVVLRRGDTLFALGQYAAAADWFASAADRPGFALADYATRRQAEALSQAGKYTEAAELFATFFTRYLNSKETAAAVVKAHALAAKLLHDHRPADALALVDRLLPVISARNDIAALLADRADAVTDLPARRGESAELYAAIVAKYPHDPVAPRAEYLAAYESLVKADYPAALRYASAFPQAYPKSELLPDARYIEAESQMQLGKYAEAEKIYAALLAQYPHHPDADSWKVRQAAALHLQKKYAETVALLEPLVGSLTHADAKAEAYYLIGSSKAEQEKFSDAVREYKASLAAQSRWRKSDEVLWELAHAYFRSGDRRRAQESLQKIVVDFPESKILDRVHYRQGEYAAAGNDPKTAATEYRTVVEKWPDGPLAPRAWQGLGWALFDQADFAAADKAFDTLATRFPQDKLFARAHYGRGMARYREGKFHEAVADLKDALTATDLSQAERSDARYVLGLSQVGLKDHADSVGTFRELLQEDPKYTAIDKVRFELAWALKATGQNKEAVEAFAALVKNCPESPLVGECQFHVGDAAYKDEKFQAAAVAFAAALEKAGKTQLGEKAAHNLGWAYYRLENFAAAQQAFAQQRGTWPQGPLEADAAFMEAECLFKQKKYEQALAAYEAVKNPSAKDFQVLTLLHSAQAIGQIKAADDAPANAKWQKTLNLLNRLVKEYPDTPYLPEALYERGWALQNQGKLDDAVAEYTKVVAKSKQEAAARAKFMIGEVQFQQKKHAEALSSFYEVLYGYPYPEWRADAAYEAARCFEVLNKKPQALKQYRELVETFPDSDKVPAAKARIKSLESE